MTDSNKTTHDAITDEIIRKCYNIIMAKDDVKRVQHSLELKPISEKMEKGEKWDKLRSYGIMANLLKLANLGIKVGVTRMNYNQSCDCGMDDGNQINSDDREVLIPSCDGDANFWEEACLELYGCRGHLLRNDASVVVRCEEGDKEEEQRSTREDSRLNPKWSNLPMFKKEFLHVIKMFRVKHITAMIMAKGGYDSDEVSKYLNRYFPQENDIYLEYIPHPLKQQNTKSLLTLTVFDRCICLLQKWCQVLCNQSSLSFVQHKSIRPPVEGNDGSSKNTEQVKEVRVAWTMYYVPQRTTDTKRYLNIPVQDKNVTHTASSQPPTPSPTDSKTSRSPASAWTKIESTCVELGVSMFGQGQWRCIKSEFPEELGKRSNVQIKDRWRVLDRRMKKAKHS